MKILCYSAKLIAGLNIDRDVTLAKRFAIISSKISGARATLRLIDDIPMLQHTLEYGLGKQVIEFTKHLMTLIIRNLLITVLFN